jgi:hypothetical protein
MASMASTARYSQRRLALRVMIAAALLGVAAGFLPALSAIRGAAARSRAAPLATRVAARRAAQPVRMRVQAHAAPPAPVRGISGSPAGPWTRLKQVAIGLLAAVSLWRGSGRWPRLHDAREPVTNVRAPGPPLQDGRDKKDLCGPSPGQLIALSCRPLPLRPVQLSLMAAPMFSCPARAAEAVHRASALPPIHSQVWVQ